MTRLCCVVPFCKRTTGRAEFREWICGDHWRLIDRDRRRAYGRYARQWRRYYRVAAAGAVTARLWGALKRMAIERAVGL